MTRADFFAWLLVFSLAASGCSVELNQPSGTVSPNASTQNPNGSPDPAKIPIAWANLNSAVELVYNTPI
jgi:hypothetical protein